MAHLRDNHNHMLIETPDATLSPIMRHMDGVFIKINLSLFS